MSRSRMLLDQWQKTAVKEYSVREFTLPLPLSDAARIEALAEMYPGRTTEQIIAELLSVALKDLEEAMPYVQGESIITKDEFGDPVYADVGLTPKFEAATRKYLKQYRSESDSVD